MNVVAADVEVLQFFQLDFADTSDRCDEVVAYIATFIPRSRLTSSGMLTALMSSNDTILLNSVLVHFYASLDWSCG